MAKGKQRKIFRKYRLVIMNDETLEEKASFNLRPLNVFVTISLAIILLITATTFLIAFTGLREYIPGYADVKTRRNVYNLVMKTDSLEQTLKSRDKFLANLRNIISGNVEAATPPRRSLSSAKYDTIHRLARSEEDSRLREMMESDDKFSLTEKGSRSGAATFLFFPPVRGMITNRFEQVKKHFGVDIVAAANQAIKATLDGTVIISDFTAETGYILAIQHSNNFFSVYKHNSALLKKSGDIVKAGDVVAIIGNSGELSEGPHLHFELWYNGNPINPQQYVTF